MMAAQVEKPDKIFVIGLPRTGTTSVSVAMLEMGFKVAHQAFTKQAFAVADVVSDAPCFSDYRQLHQLFPNAKFVYLDRALDAWVPSMQMLLSRMLVHLDQQAGRFHPIMKRSFEHSFNIHQVADPMDVAHLVRCYQTHQAQVLEYFSLRPERKEQFLALDVSQGGSLKLLADFVGIHNIGLHKDLGFPHLNRGRNVASWDEYKHPHKISSNVAGPENRKFFDYKLLK